MSNSDQERPFSSAEALRFGWNTTLANRRPLLTLGAVGVVLALFNRALTGPQAGWGARPLTSLVIQILQVALALAYTRSALLLCDGHPIDLGRITELLSGFFTYLLVSVLYTLVVGFGLVLLIVPGVLWGLKYGYSTFLVVDHKIDPIDAFRESDRITQGVRGQLLGFFLILIGVNLLGALALGIGLLVTVPTTFIAAAHVLRRLEVRAAHRRPEPTVQMHAPLRA